MSMCMIEYMSTPPQTTEPHTLYLACTHVVLQSAYTVYHVHVAILPHMCGDACMHTHMHTHAPPPPPHTQAHLVDVCPEVFRPCPNKCSPKLQKKLAEVLQLMKLYMFMYMYAPYFLSLMHATINFVLM